MRGWVVLMVALFCGGMVHGEETGNVGKSENECGQVRYYPTGYEINGRRYFYNNFYFRGWDMHHGVEPSWPSRNPPNYYYYHGYWDYR